MSKLSFEEIRKRFELSKEFNEIFDAFEQAVEQRLEDIGLYRLLFWNPTLTPDELSLFGEKLAKEFPDLAYDSFTWLANIFEATHSMVDNYELALTYYKKAAAIRPSERSPYLRAAACYERDLNIPPISDLINFLKQGAEYVNEPIPLYQRLIELYELNGNDEMCNYYRRKIHDSSSGNLQFPQAE
jgi:tetratricopeptide (TPR) repeat protein